MAKMAVSDLMVVTIVAVTSLSGDVIAQQNGPVTLQVPTSNYAARSIKFDAKLFTEFFKCLCEGTVTNCTASYDNNQGDWVVKTLIPSGVFIGDPSLPKYYQCELITYDNRLTCLKLNLTSSVCSTTLNFQSARFNVTPTCEKSCFTVFWKYTEKDLPAGWFSQCDANSGCADLTSTSLLTSTPTKAPNPSSSPHASLSPSLFSSSSEFSSTSNSSASPLSNSTTQSAGTTPPHSTTPSAGTTLSVPPFVAGFIINLLFGISFTSL